MSGLDNLSGQKCKNCRYYRAPRGALNGVVAPATPGRRFVQVGLGQCRVNPPVVVVETNGGVGGNPNFGRPHTVWPVVQKDDWCGRFVRAET